MYGCAPCACSAWYGQKRAFGSPGFCIVGIHSERRVLPRDGKHITLCRSPPESRLFFLLSKCLFSQHIPDSRVSSLLWASVCGGVSLVTDWLFFFLLAASVPPVRIHPILTEISSVWGRCVIYLALGECDWEFPLLPLFPSQTHVLMYRPYEFLGLYFLMFWYFPS